MEQPSARAKKSLFDRFLHFVEVGGNALPHPASIFGLLALSVLFFSWLGFIQGWSATHPATGETVTVVNLLSREGIHRIFLDLVDNYTSFAPLGIVMVALLGIGMAEGSGLISAAIRLLVLKAPRRLITFVIVTAGILSNTASDLGYVLIIPLAGVVFHALGRHPIAGMAAAFAGVSGGFSANLFIGTIDPLLAGLSTESARILDETYYVLPTANYYFMAASTFIIAILATWITHAVVEPRLGKYQGDVMPEPINPLTDLERKGLRRVVWLSLAWLVLILITTIPANGFFRGPDNSILRSPLLKGFIALLFFAAGSLGIVYGATTGKYKRDADVIKGMTESFKSLAAFMVLVFFAAQFVAWFRWSHLGLIIAIRGAEVLHQLNLGMVPLLIMFVLLSGFINLFMGSASAKWAILGPVFIPMFMLLGYSPELSQAVFRVGDSVTNIISPMMSFFALIIVYFEKYDPRAGIGTLISTMLPYSLWFFVVWTAFLVLWALLGIPLGPGAPIYYP
ncbi:MAG: AbgT family transporter [Bacteroidetes bacterium]|nr:AbgT family transporter [Bacteroidota bacterium]